MTHEECPLNLSMRNVSGTLVGSQRSAEGGSYSSVKWRWMRAEEGDWSRQVISRSLAVKEMWGDGGMAGGGTWAKGMSHNTGVTWAWLHVDGASLVAQTVTSLPALRRTQVRSLGQDDPLKKEMATCSSILAWKIPWMEEPGRLESMGLQRVGHDWATWLHMLMGKSWGRKGEGWAEGAQSLRKQELGGGWEPKMVEWSALC